MTRTKLWTLALACALLAAVSLAQDVRAKAGASGLHILLTNDDGIEAVGLQTLKTALRDAGHRVTVLAPNRNYSGSSASVGFGPVAVEEVGPGEYAADASPATCALLGLTAWTDPERPFDLLVSGTNLGANAGPATGISGTVGATTIAASGMAGAVPAIAFSSTPPGDLADAAAADPETHRRHFRNVAEFAVRLIDRLAERRVPAGARPAPAAGAALTGQWAQVKGRQPSLPYPSEVAAISSWPVSPALRCRPHSAMSGEVMMSAKVSFDGNSTTSTSSHISSTSPSTRCLAAP